MTELRAVEPSVQTTTTENTCTLQGILANRKGGGDVTAVMGPQRGGDDGRRTRIVDHMVMDVFPSWGIGVGLIWVVSHAIDN